MASEKEEDFINSTEIVEHFYSPVVEAIALLSSFVNPSQHEFASTTHEQLMKEIPLESKGFIQEWQQNSNSDFLDLFNLFLPVPYITDIEQFVYKLDLLPNEEFMYHFFGEEIPLVQVKELISSPSSVDSFEPHILWETTDQRHFITELFSNIDSYREKISQLLLHIANSNAFQYGVSENKETIEKSLANMKTLQMKPLNLAQYVMGKTFKRTSLYKMYYFIPSYFFTPHRIRIFNQDICIVIYGCADPISDTRETSAELEIKLKALSDRNRLLMLRMLSGKREYGARLAEYLGITTATVSHHLEILKKAGFIKEEKVGNIKYFTCNMESTKEIFDSLTNFVLADKA
jgi:DNA-binding transcriptional ArsR family regulator